MYIPVPPRPIEIDLNTPESFELRQKAARYLAAHPNVTGAERGTMERQGYGALAEIVIRKQLGLEPIKDEDHPIAYDLLLPSGVKVDVKCRGGDRPFLESYESSDGVPREAKHNFYARQIYDDTLDTDVYLMTHLMTPSDGTLPGTPRQRKWKLYICGWVSKARVKREGVYLSRGAISERANSWFPYQGQEIEFYHRHLNGLETLAGLLKLDPADVRSDADKTGNLHLTSADAIRITSDLVGRGVLEPRHLEKVKGELGIPTAVKPILHPNQYFHLLEWLKIKGHASDAEIKKLEAVMKREDFTGI